MGSTPARKSKSLWDDKRETGNVWLSIADMPSSLHAVANDSKEYVSDAAAKSMKVVPAGTLLVSFKLTLGRLCYAGRDLFTNEAIAALLNLDERAVTKEFLYWYLTFFDWHAAAAGDEKVKGKTLNKAKLKELEVWLPPLEEQKRIVAVLDQAFAALNRALALAEANLADAAAIDQAIIDALTDSSISGEYRQSLNDLCDLIVDCEHKTAPLSQSDIASIRTPNIGKGRLVLDGVNTVSEEVYRLWSRRAVPAPGDLILAREAPAGNVGVIPEGLRCVLGQRTVLIRPKASKIHSDFLALYLLNTKTQRRLLSHSTGATVQHVNMKDIRALPIETLPPIDLQLEVVAKSEVLRTSASRAESDYRSKAESIKTLRKALLQKAFAGELI